MTPLRAGLRLGCCVQAGAEGVTLLCIEARGWQSALHIEALNLVEGCPLFSHLDVRDKRNLVRSMKKREFSMGEALCRIGERCPNLMMIASGEVKVLKRSAKGLPLEMAVLSAGDLIDEKCVAQPSTEATHASDMVAASQLVVVFEIPWHEFELHFRHRRHKNITHYKDIANSRAITRALRMEKLNAVVTQKPPEQIDMLPRTRSKPKSPEFALHEHHLLVLLDPQARIRLCGGGFCGWNHAQRATAS